MSDREKVIRGLELCVTDYLTQDNCKICPYGNGDDTGYCWVEMNTDALELLKEQEEEIQSLRRENHDILTQFHEWTKEQQQIVRCKDCNNRGTSDCPIEELCNGWIPSDDWFCADGERKEGR